MVKGKYYFPGCGYIDNIIQLYKNQDIFISFIEFKQPLILIEGINQCLQTDIHQTAKTEYRAQFHFKDQKSNEWIQTSNANFQLLDHGNDIPSPKYNIEQIIKNKCNLTKLTKNELYTHIKSKAGLNYTGVFQGVTECYIGDDCTLSVIHGMIGLVNDQCQIVFDKAIGLKYYSSNIPTGLTGNSIYVYSIFKARLGNSYIGSIVVMLSDGTVIFEIKELVCKSLTPIKESLKVEPPDELYSVYLQPKDSQIPTPSSFKSIIYDNNYFKTNTGPIIPEDLFKYISTLFYKNIIQRCSEISIDKINSQTVDEIISRYSTISKHERLFKFVFETIKENGIFNSLDGRDDSYFEFNEHLIKSTRIISKLLFTLENDNDNEDSPQSLFQNGLMDRIYSCEYLKKKNQMIAHVIKHSIKEIINNNIIVRILEFGGGVASLSVEAIKEIVTLLQENPNYKVEIEYTWSDISPSFITDAKNKINKIINDANIKNGLNDIYRPLTIDESLIEIQSIKPSYYDFIIPDKLENLEKTLIETANKSDIIITSGGVSMGHLDLVKSLLEKIGKVHFGRVNMKPGKPSTFSTITSNNNNNKTTLVFSLPGNPVSTVVTFYLFVVLRMLSGFGIKQQTNLPSVQVKLLDRIALDHERPEYHRCSIEWDFNENCFVSKSTGSQASCRLLSLKQANALLVLPQKHGHLERGSLVKAILIGPVTK
ncbi:hypothetical protein ACTFIU_003618 [Dictyostelium citrinum]